MGSIQVGGQLMDLRIPKIMAILNLTPDSFYDGGKHNSVENALQHVGRLLAEGADILDIGAYSSRPGAQEVGEQEEIDRLLPVIEAIREQHPEAILSIDTFRAKVADETLRAGAHLINDIGGGRLDGDLFSAVAKWQVPYVLMHSRGTPKTMQQLTHYENLLLDMVVELSGALAELRKLGIKDVIVDPGFGFAKTLEQNYLLLSRLEELKVMGLPILGALSRKSMIYKLLGNSPQQALNGSTALHTLLLMKGVQMIRVHDVKEAVEVRTLVSQLQG